MTKSLVIVESPTKANTIKKYLGKGFSVKATVGHIRDLPKSTLGVDVEHDFAPTYETIRGKKKVIDELIAAAGGCDVIYLAPDPDREGEAIAWHVREALSGGTPKKGKKKVAPTAGPIIHRVLFHEITAAAVKEAIAHPRAIDDNLVEAQQARRILDRIVGYQVSPLLWDKVRRGLSAGRVQSVALRMICERERDIEKFVAQEYWSIVVTLEGSVKPQFEAKLVEWRGKKLEKLDINAATQAKDIVAAVQAGPFRLRTITKQERKRNPVAPFITSKLQQESARKLGFTAKKTMMLAQRLYEGIELGDEGAVGLITYMRTDSVRVSDTALAQVRDIIQSRYGAQYLPKEPNQYKNKKGAQDAHEAIRPTLLDYPPERVREFLEPDAWKLYDLIWKRFVSSQMVPARFDQTTFDITAADVAMFRASGSILTFDGFIAVYAEGSDDAAAADEEDNAMLPALAEGETLRSHGIVPNQHFTQPPPRYTEASLVKTMEEEGIGRPSTYAAIMTKIQEQEYVEKLQGRFTPTQLGKIVNDLLVAHFPDIINVGFTARMEDELDEVEEGRRRWVSALRDFYGPFASTLERAKVEMRDIKRQEIPTDHACEKCGQTMVIKWGRNGEFLACSAYPECKSTAEFKRVEGKIELVKEDTTTTEVCVNCGAPMLMKRGKFGKFLACSRYPECKTTKGISVGVPCPQDGGDLVEKRSRFGKNFYSCANYPNCKFALWDKPILQPCPQCQAPFLLQTYSKKTGAGIKCHNKECGYKQQVETEEESA